MKLYLIRNNNNFETVGIAPTKETAFEIAEQFQEILDVEIAVEEYSLKDRAIDITEECYNNMWIFCKKI